MHQYQRHTHHKHKGKGKARPQATNGTATASTGGTGDNDDRKRKDPSDRRIKTLYTPETYQTPSPAWSWITPWMINMRTGTDESGWRYNAWFKQRGWSSHASFAGWGGWVRRREWVRLRGIVPASPGNEEDTPPAGREEPKGNKSLAEVLVSDDCVKNVMAIEKALGRYALDREKLEAWERWLRGTDDQSREKLQAVLNDPDCVSAHSLCHSSFLLPKLGTTYLCSTVPRPRPPIYLSLLPHCLPPTPHPASSQPPFQPLCKAISA